jgi:hypothetical protein
MREYKWEIAVLNCVPKEGKMIDVVSVINWRRLPKQNIQETTIQVSIYGTMNCPYPLEKNFTPYADLTFEQICQWLEAGLNVSELDANLDIQIDNILNPKIITLPLPWVK